MHAVARQDAEPDMTFAELLSDIAPSSGIPTFKVDQENEENEKPANP